MDCKNCKTRHRADNLIGSYDASVKADTMSQEEMLEFIRLQKVPCPKCGKSDFSDIRQFTFRTIEFEQMVYQTFCKKGEDDSLYEYFKNYGIEFFQFLGIVNEHLRFHDHDKLAHYAKAACDIEYLFPFGWGEINGTHNRTDFDLQRHQDI